MFPLVSYEKTLFLSANSTSADKKPSKTCPHPWYCPSPSLQYLNLCPPAIGPNLPMMEHLPARLLKPILHWLRVREGLTLRPWNMSETALGQAPSSLEKRRKQCLSTRRGNTMKEPWNILPTVQLMRDLFGPSVADCKIKTVWIRQSQRSLREMTYYGDTGNLEENPPSGFESTAISASQSDKFRLENAANRCMANSDEKVSLKGGSPKICEWVTFSKGRCITCLSTSGPYLCCNLFSGDYCVYFLMRWGEN